MIGETLGSYRVTEKLGEGGMGQVFRGEHSLIGRKAAIKILHPNYSKDKNVVERFFNEARAASLIEHGGIVSIFDFGYGDDGSAYIVMELLTGEPLTDRMRAGAMAPSDVVRIARQAASALQAAHDAGIVHRDLKPDNLFLFRDEEVTGGERVKVLDFGIAKLIGDASRGVVKTRTGQVFGSPLYMSPEQCKGAQAVDHRSDIYSLGCVMYQMVCGSAPFGAEGVGEVLGKHMYETPEPLATRSSNAPAALVDITERCLAKKPDDRFESMQALVTAFDGFAGRNSSSRRAVSGPAAVAETMPDDSSVLDTTLGAAASQAEVTTSPGGSSAIWLAVGGVVVAAAAAVVFVVIQSDGSESPYTQNDIAAAASPDGDAAPPEDTSTDGEEPAEDPPAGEPPPENAAASVERVTFTITSEPKAYVRDMAGDLLGETPFTHRAVKAEIPIAFKLHAAGYEPETVVLKPDRDRSERIELDEVESRRRTSSRGASTRKPSGQSKPAAKKSEPAPKTEKPKTGDPVVDIDPLADDKP